MIIEHRFYNKILYIVCWLEWGSKFVNSSRVWISEYLGVNCMFYYKNLSGGLRNLFQFRLSLNAYRRLTHPTSIIFSDHHKYKKASMESKLGDKNPAQLTKIFMKKTNAVRILENLEIQYELLNYQDF